MSESTVSSADGAKQSARKAEPASGEWPHFPSLEHAESILPRLHARGARPLVRDRWERLVTSIDTSATLEEVWHALTDPGALSLWLAVCHGSLAEVHRDSMLDFEDGEFFLCRPTTVTPLSQLQYLWRWLGIGQATSVTWKLQRLDTGTCVTVTEEALNPPWDWQTWNGGGWPGILEQLAAYLRTGTEWRWPWRRMGPYAQIELPTPFYTAWDQLLSPAGLRYWLQVMRGSLGVDQSLTILMGDASGTVEMLVREIIQPGQSAPSFLPYVNFALQRQVWHSEVGGRLWMEPAGLGRSLLQVFHYNWENVSPGLQLSERKILAGFWMGAMRRASLMCGEAQAIEGPHSWS